MEGKQTDELLAAVFEAARRDGSNTTVAMAERRQILPLHYAVIDYWRAIRSMARKASSMDRINNYELNALNRPVDDAKARITHLMHTGNVDPKLKTREDWKIRKWDTGEEVVIRGRTALDVVEWLRDRSGTSYMEASYGLPAYEMRLWASNYAVDAPVSARRQVKA